VAGSAFARLGGVSGAEGMGRLGSAVFSTSLSGRLHQPLVSTRQLDLALRRDERVLAIHLEVAVARGLRGPDGTAAHRLPPSDVRWAWRFAARRTGVTGRAPLLGTFGSPCIGEALGTPASMDG